MHAALLLLQTERQGEGQDHNVTVQDVCSTANSTGALMWLVGTSPAWQGIPDQGHYFHRPNSAQLHTNIQVSCDSGQ